jgi:hypothetical protein
MAFYYLQLMVKALQQIVKGEVGDATEGVTGREGAVGQLTTKLRTEGGAQLLPNNQHCHDHICKFLEGDRPKCAYSFLPKAMGPDVGDWIVNQTDSDKKAWVNKGTGEDACNQEQRQECLDFANHQIAEGSNMPGMSECAKKRNDECFEADCVKNEEKCGYYDAKRGMYGEAGDQPLMLKVGRIANQLNCFI